MIGFRPEVPVDHMSRDAQKSSAAQQKRSRLKIKLSHVPKSGDHRQQKE